MDGTAPLQPPKVSAPQISEFAVEDIDRDSDSDGWTDIEEQTLGFDPRRRDSDGDGLEDADDPAPSYAPPASDAGDEDIQILQDAIFAVFGLSESPWVLFARDDTVRKLQPRGLPEPVVFNKPLKSDPLTGGPGGVFVTWKLVSKDASEAVVEISDWEGPLAAGGQEVRLRKLHDAWIVVARKTTWIS
jgi:hypothetical protein